jgi:hypothetical protein
VAVLLRAALAVAWYVSGRRRLGRSLMPLTIAAAVEVVKLAAMPVEWSDTADEVRAERERLHYERFYRCGWS